MINYAPLDRYTLSHAAFGLMLGAWRVPLPWVIAAAAGYEIIEPTLKEKTPYFFPYASKDSFVNAAGDALATVAAWYLWTAIFERR
jgi:hypothetical protein